MKKQTNSINLKVSDVHDPVFVKLCNRIKPVKSMSKGAAGKSCITVVTDRLKVVEDFFLYAPKKKPLYKHGDHEVWDAKDYLRPVVMTSSQRFWLVMGTVVVAAVGFRGILFLISLL